MRKFLSYILSFPGIICLVVGLVIMALALGVAGGSKGISVLTRAMRAFTDNLKV